MNKLKLLYFLACHKSKILEEWHLQFVVNAKKTGMETVDAYLQTLDGFYLDLISVLERGNIQEIHPDGNFQHLTKSKVRLKLPFLMEVFFSGEEVVYKQLFSKHVGQYFSHAEIASFLESIADAFAELIRYYSSTFCQDCTQPLMATHHQIIELGQKVSDYNFAHGKKSGGFDE
jgi:hypothetical protein